MKALLKDLTVVAVKFTVLYTLGAVMMAGYLNGMNAFLSEDFKHSKADILGYSLAWPYAFGMLMAGKDMAGGMEASVETEEEFDVDLDSVVGDGELVVARLAGLLIIWRS